MAAKDVAFTDAGKKEGIQVYRIEKLKVIPQTDPAKLGKFYSGDAYLVLHTEKVQSALKWNIHFWLGAESSQDEQGVAAYKTVELDDHLGGAPVQHREVQGSESQLFLSYWKPFGGIKYLEGGISSGFKHVDRNAFTKRLFHVKGKRNVRVSQVELSHKSLNQGDVFILDCGLKIFQWNGKTSNKTERAKGFDVVRDMKDNERGGRAAVIVIDADKNDDDTDFFNELGSKGPIAAGDEDDEAFEKKKNAQVQLYEVSDASGKLQTTLVGSAPLNKNLLKSDETYVLDAGNGLFVWIGKKSTKEEKNGAWNVALKYITDKGYPMSTPVTRLNEGAETTIFIQQFAVWPSPQSSPNYAVKAGKNVAKVEQKAVDFGKLHAPGAPPKQPMVDDGTGKIKLWRIENFQKVEVTDPKLHGQFFQGDSYILLYTYKNAQGKELYICYFWQGHDSSQDERGASALLAKGIDDELGGAATVVRVVQNKEPDHFLALFKGKFIIHKGGVDSGFKNAQPTGLPSGGADVRLYQVNGTNVYNTKATEVDCNASSLRSSDAFVLVQKKGTTYVWYGKGATGDERDMAKVVAERLVSASSIETVFEGAEKNDFWALLGGKGEYLASSGDASTAVEPRLFEMSNASGSFKVEEVFNWDQTDLISDEIYLLDCRDEIWLWIGVDSNDIEKKSSLEAALQYLKADSSRSQDTPIITVKQGTEPPLFKAYFVGWDDAKATSNVRDYEKLKQSLMSGNSATSGSVADQLKKFSATYPYAKLLERPLPEGIDAGSLENHLNEDEFPKVFGKTKDEFLKMPKWKQTEAKKAKKLY